MLDTEASDPFPCLYRADKISSPNTPLPALSATPTRGDQPGEDPDSGNSSPASSPAAAPAAADTNTGSRTGSGAVSTSKSVRQKQSFGIGAQGAKALGILSRLVQGSGATTVHDTVITN